MEPRRLANPPAIPCPNLPPKPYLIIPARPFAPLLKALSEAKP